MTATARKVVRRRIAVVADWDCVGIGDGGCRRGGGREEEGRRKGERGYLFEGGEWMGGWMVGRVGAGKYRWISVCGGS